jgi:hypothetical protein
LNRLGMWGLRMHAGSLKPAVNPLRSALAVETGPLIVDMATAPGLYASSGVLDRGRLALDRPGATLRG